MTSDTQLQQSKWFPGHCDEQLQQSNWFPRHCVVVLGSGCLPTTIIGSIVSHHLSWLTMEGLLICKMISQLTLLCSFLVFTCCLRKDDTLTPVWSVFVCSKSGQRIQIFLSFIPLPLRLEFYIWTIIISSKFFCLILLLKRISKVGVRFL